VEGGKKNSLFFTNVAIAYILYAFEVILQNACEKFGITRSEAANGRKEIVIALTY
jgi:hypothetical protein